MTKDIKLSKETSVDLSKLIAGKLLVQANSGGGKSWLIRRLVEQAYGKVQIIILDPEGEFSTLREKFDFVLAGKGGETSADPRSAALLARRLLELKVSAIVDLYELHPQERKRFVRIFLDAMVNIPKELYNPCLIVLDEAHMFAPEKGEAESLGAVIDIASRGRKRDQSLILATQRISKLHKDAAAECNNKLIGRSSLDIDRKRAADELGITGKEEILALRTLKPGEFFAFGPAISDEVIKIKVGTVETSIPKGGASFKVTPPTAGIKKILGKLADLPQEAKKESENIKDLQAELRALRKHQCPVIQQKPVKIEKIQVPVIGKRAMEGLKKSEQNIRKMLKSAKEVMQVMETSIEKLSGELEWSSTTKVSGPGAPQPAPHVRKPIPLPYSREEIAEDSREIPGEFTLGICAKKVYSFLVKNDLKAFSKVQLGAVTGYSPKSGGFNNAISQLSSLGLARREGSLIKAGRIDFDHVIESDEYTPELWLKPGKLGKCELAIYQLLWNDPHNVFTKDEVGSLTGYSAGSGGFNNSISRLNSIGLIERVTGGLRLNQELLTL